MRTTKPSTVLMKLQHAWTPKICDDQIPDPGTSHWRPLRSSAPEPQDPAPWKKNEIEGDARPVTNTLADSQLHKYRSSHPKQPSVYWMGVIVCEVLEKNKQAAPRADCAEQKGWMWPHPDSSLTWQAYR